MQPASYPAHDFAEDLPFMTEEEFQGLTTNIKEHGLLHPILLFEGKILDGRNRARACQEARVPPRFEEFKGTRLQALEFVESENYHRRHMNEFQKGVYQARKQARMAEFVVVAKAAQGAHSANNKRKSEGLNTVSAPQAVTDTRTESKAVAAQLAADAQISQRTAERAIAYVKAEQAGNVAPKIQEAVTAGRLTGDAALNLVRQPVKVQEKVLVQATRAASKDDRGASEIRNSDVKRVMAELGRDEQRKAALKAAAAAPKQSTPDVRVGRYQDVCKDVQCDVVICDPPYSARTHASATTRDDSSNAAGLTPQYAAWSPADVLEFVQFWHTRTKGWIVCLTDSELVPAYQRAFEAVGRTTFAPLPCVWKGMSVRMNGDGPSSWSVFAMVARPSSKTGWKTGTLPGAYVDIYETGKTGAGSNDATGGRGKPEWLMQALVRDYSLEGNIVCDPVAGFGSTLVSAAALKRHVVGCDVDATAREECITNLMALRK